MRPEESGNALTQLQWSGQLRRSDLLSSCMCRVVEQCAQFVQSAEECGVGANAAI